MTTERKKILVIMDGIGPKNARGSDIIYSILERLTKMGMDMHILTLIDYRTRENWKEWMREKEERCGISFHYFNNHFLKRFHRLYLYFFKTFSFFTTISLCQKHHFDIIHEYSSSPLLCYKTALLKPFIKKGGRLYQTLCTANTLGLKDIFIKPLKYLDLDKIICHSQNAANILTKKGCPQEKVLYLPIGVELDKFGKTDKFEAEKILKDKYYLLKDKKKILYLGPLVEQKGVFLLADIIPEVIKSHPEAFSIFVFPKFNDGKYRKNKERLLDKISKYKENVLLVEGMVNTASFFAISDIFVYPLKSPLGTLSIPLTLLEAMAAGNAVIASSVGGNREIIKDRENGLLFSIGNKSQLTELIKELLKEEELRKRLGFKAQKTIENNFDIKTNSQKLYNLYLS